MSDERDGADTAGEGADSPATAVTGTATPPRPTGKRSRQRAAAGIAVEDVTEAIEVAADTTSERKVKPPKKKSDSGASRNPFVFVFTYLKQVVAELRKVIWPNRKQMVSYTSVVLLFLAFMVALIGVVDLGLAKLVLQVFG